MADRGKTQTGGGRRQNARYGQKAKQKWKAATPGLETAVFGFGAVYTPDTFQKAYSALTKYIGAGNLDKKGGPEAAKALRKFKVPEFTAPVRREDVSDKIADAFYDKGVNQYVEDVGTWERVNKKIFNLLLTHCNPEMELKLQTMKDWESIEDDQNGLKLAILIRDILHQKDEQE